MPMVLGIGTLEKSQLAERIPLVLRGKCDMPGRDAELLHGLDGGGGEMRMRLAFRKVRPHKHAPPCDGSERDGGLKLGIITPACTLIGLGPGMVEDVFAIGVRFEIAWHERSKRAASVPQGKMGRMPPHFCRSRSALLQGKEKRVSQKWIVRPARRIRTAVPFLWTDFVHPIEDAYTQCSALIVQTPAPCQKRSVRHLCYPARNWHRACQCQRLGQVQPASPGVKTLNAQISREAAIFRKTGYQWTEWTARLWNLR